MNKRIKELEEEIKRLRERMAVLESSARYYYPPVIINPVYPVSPPVITYISGTPTTLRDYTFTC
jgi:hypothetical protein